MVNERELLDLDISELANSIIESEYRNYFLGKPGEEHYRLLAHFSTNYNGVNLIDVGSYKGCSALALSYNKNNIVYSFDIVDGLKQLSDYPNNIKFVVDNVTNTEYIDLLLSSPFIMLDTYHDGTFEGVFYNHLKDINYKGILFLDDIKLNKPMIDFWNSITEEKIDSSSVGHHSGTGIVYFN